MARLSHYFAVGKFKWDLFALFFSFCYKHSLERVCRSYCENRLRYPGEIDGFLLGQFVCKGFTGSAACRPCGPRMHKYGGDGL